MFECRWKVLSFLRNYQILKNSLKLEGGDIV